MVPGTVYKAKFSVPGTVYQTTLGFLGTVYQTIFKVPWNHITELHAPNLPSDRCHKFRHRYYWP